MGVDLNNIYPGDGELLVRASLAHKIEGIDSSTYLGAAIGTLNSWDVMTSYYLPDYCEVVVFLEKDAEGENEYIVSMGSPTSGSVIDSGLSMKQAVAVVESFDFDTYKWVATYNRSDGSVGYLATDMLTCSWLISSDDSVTCPETALWFVNPGFLRPNVNHAYSSICRIMKGSRIYCANSISGSTIDGIPFDGELAYELASDSGGYSRSNSLTTFAGGVVFCHGLNSLRGQKKIGVYKYMPDRSLQIYIKDGLYNSGYLVVKESEFDKLDELVLARYYRLFGFDISIHDKGFSFIQEIQDEGDITLSYNVEFDSGLSISLNGRKILEGEIYLGDLFDKFNQLASELTGGYANVD